MVEFRTKGKGSDRTVYPIEEIRRRKIAKARKLLRELTSRKNREAFDEPAARELELFIENDEQLYRQQGLPIIKNLTAKKARGIYNSEKAAVLYKYLADNGAKKYEKEFGGHFDPATRRAVARSLRNQFETEYKTGAYSEYIPKKYRPKHSHRGMQQTEYCPRCGRYLTREDLP